MGDHRGHAPVADELHRPRHRRRSSVGARRDHGRRRPRRAAARRRDSRPRPDVRPSMPSVVALIPARSGSERVRDKNVRPLAGHPLIAYAIACARQSGLFERVVCSTDSTKIADVARRYGADVPFLRPPELATATSPDIEWITHALEQLGDHYDLFAIVRATNPFRGPDVLKRGFDQ